MYVCLRVITFSDHPVAAVRAGLQVPAQMRTFPLYLLRSLIQDISALPSEINDDLHKIQDAFGDKCLADRRSFA